MCAGPVEEPPYVRLAKTARILYRRADVEDWLAAELIRAAQMNLPDKAVPMNQGD